MENDSANRPRGFSFRRFLTRNVESQTECPECSQLAKMLAVRRDRLASRASAREINSPTSRTCYSCGSSDSTDNRGHNSCIIAANERFLVLAFTAETIETVSTTGPIDTRARGAERSGAKRSLSKPQLYCGIKHEFRLAFHNRATQGRPHVSKPSRALHNVAINAHVRQMRMQIRETGMWLGD